MDNQQRPIVEHMELCSGTIGTDLTNPDFEMIGRAFGFNVTRISAVQQLDGLPAILESREPEFIVVATSVKAILPEPFSASLKPTAQ